MCKEVAARKQEIDEAGIDAYPQYARAASSATLQAFRGAANSLKSGEQDAAQKRRIIEGRIRSLRTSGSKLAFIVVSQGPNERLQVVLNQRVLQVDEAEFRKLRLLMRRGDVIAVEGYGYRTNSGELSIMATSLPRVLSPCLHHFPVGNRQQESPQEEDTAVFGKHVQLLAQPESLNVLLARSEIIHRVRTFFRSRDFVEVETPILSASAGGASARPFETSATEFPDRKLALRIAPELWLKRLVLGGMERIFEIGPSFRNEGLDRIHNPEFTTCEFYSTYTSLPQLIDTTQQLLRSVAVGLGEQSFPTLGIVGSDFPRIDFIPALNTALDLELPNLSSDKAAADLVAIFQQKAVPVPSKTTLPRLLDRLSSVYLEPECHEFTWITGHPECMSPLSKSYTHPTAPNSQSVAARAELFVQGREIVNCYEEENSPFEQRRKFKMQQQYATANGDGGKADDEVMPIDEGYLKALEWGLPPTGGWGCGIDRLVMLFTGKERIRDVLSFGDLRAVTRR